MERYNSITFENASETDATSLPRSPRLPPKILVQRSFSNPNDVQRVLEDSDYLDTVTSTKPILSQSFNDRAQYLKEDDDSDKEADDILKELHQSQTTIKNIHEDPNYIDSLQSNASGTALLAKSALNLSHDGVLDPIYPPPKKTVQQVIHSQLSVVSLPEKHRYIKNLVVLSIGMMLIFIAYTSLRNLQSSINHEAGLGLKSLSAIYAALFVGGIVAPAITSKLRPKYTILVAQCSFALYVGANFYPSHYTLIPASVVVGLGAALLWTAHGTYVTSIASLYAGLTGKVIRDVLSRFNGIFMLFFHSSQVIGGIISSTVLNTQRPHMDNDQIINMNASFQNESVMYDHSTMNESRIRDYSFCGSHYCHSHKIDHFSVDISPDIFYMLMGIYASCAIAGIVIVAIFLDKLDNVIKRNTKPLREQLLGTFHWFADKRVLLLSFLMPYGLMQMAFMYAEFTKAFVTCPLGVHWVGYIMLSMAVCAAVMSYVVGRLQKYVGRIALFTTAAIINILLLVVMLLWKPTPDQLMIFFLIAAGWGMADAIWGTQMLSLLGVLFADNKEACFAGVKMLQSLGATAAFLYAPYLCMTHKIYILFVMLVLGMSGYIALEVHLWKEEKAALNEEKERVPAAV